MRPASFAAKLRHRRAILILGAVALSIYHLVAAQWMYPVTGGDSVTFLPPAINLKAGHGLTNSLWHVNPDPLGKNRFLEQPPAFQLIVSACMWRAETKNAFMVLAIFNVLTLSLYVAFLCTARMARELMDSGPGFFLQLLSLPALAFLVFHSSDGRPEAFSALLVCLTVGSLVWLPQKWQVWWFGLAIGTAAAVHPAHGIFLACLVVIALLLQRNSSLALRDMFLAALVAIAIFCLILNLGPHPLRETLRAVSRHASEANLVVDTFVAHYLRLAPWSGIYLTAITLLLGLCFAHILRVTSDKNVLALRLSALFLTSAVFWYFSIWSPNKSFYLTMLSPALAAGGIYLFQAGKAWRSRRLTAVIVCLSAAFCGAFSLFLARDVALLVNYKSHGVSFVDAQSEFLSLERSTSHQIYVSESLWVLADDFERIKIVERGSVRGEVIVTQQTQRQSLTARPPPAYRLISDTFVPYPPTFLGLPIGRTMPGYSFAIFEKDNPLPEVKAD